MKLMPSSTARRSTRCACLRSRGSPQMLPLSITRIAPKPRRWTVRSPIFSCKFTNDSDKAERYAREALVVELLRRVARQMVMRIAVERGVGDHDRRKPMVAERPVIRPGDPRDERRRGDALRGELCVLA